MSAEKKHKQPEDALAAQTKRLEDLNQEIDAIIKHHGQVPADPGIRESYAAKLQERYKIKEHIMFPHKKSEKTTNTDPPTLSRPLDQWSTSTPENQHHHLGRKTFLQYTPLPRLRGSLSKMRLRKFIFVTEKGHELVTVCPGDGKMVSTAFLPH
jgi:hypothetical protein